jgi:signal transduction histidine kinase
LRELAAVRVLIGDKLAEMQRAISLYDKGDFAAAQTLLKMGEGRDLMEDIRTQLLGMIAEERRLLDTRRGDSASTNTTLLAANLAGTGVILLIGAISVYLVQRNSRQREQARRELLEANENLEAIVAERTADLREANDEIQRFAYIVSHDLRSPLVNIMGFTTEIESIKKDTFAQLSAMHETDTDAAQKTLELSKDFDESLVFIKSSIGKMDRLINSILKLSREGQRTFKPEYVSMDQLIKTITDAVAHQAAEKDAEITVEPLPPLKSDRLALEQIFSNLVDNALKYTRPDLPGRIRIRGRVETAQVVYEVEDNGRGIAPEDHQRVFDLFRRAGQQDQKGEGIGLAHTRALVRRLGGYMTLKSALGEGSTFIVTLPRRMQENERQAA